MMPLTTLRDDERLFRDSVYEFADREVRPHAHEMDEQAKMPRPLLDKLFAMGLLGIEIPERLGTIGTINGIFARLVDGMPLMAPSFE